MPRADLIRPSGDGAAETSNLERHLRVGEVAADLGDPLVSEFGIGVFVDLTHDFFRVPREPHLAMGVAGTQ